MKEKLDTAFFNDLMAIADSIRSTIKGASVNNIQSPRTDDAGIEAEIQAKGKTAARITPDALTQAIASEHYFTALQGVSGEACTDGLVRNLLWEKFFSVNVEGDGVIEPLTNDEIVAQLRKQVPNVKKEVPAALGLLTICVLVLRNGFTVTGESACASPANYDEGIGRRIAFENAKNKVWPLLGYVLKEQLYQEHLAEDARAAADLASAFDRI